MSIIAELILHNGKIWTGDQGQPEVSSIAVAKGRILAAGGDKQIKNEFCGAETECIDLEGKLLIPGLNDSHMHLTGIGSQLEKVELAGCRSVEDLVKRFQSAARPEGNNWYSGRGFNHEQFHDHRMPTKHDLDQISTEIPVVAVRTCGHVAICNSKLLEMAGIVKGFGQVEGGEIGYDASGEPNGFLAESALALIWGLAPQSTEEDYQRIIARAVPALLAVGLTSVQSDDLGNEFWDEKIAAYHKLYQQGQLPLRINHQLRLGSPEQVLAFVKWREDHKHTLSFDPLQFAYGPVKLMTDGSLGGRTAAMSEPYADDPTTMGVPVLTREQMVAIFKAAHENGFQLCGHAIGDQAIIDLVEAAAEVISENERTSARPRVIHAQITTQNMLERMQELSFHCDIQPAFVATDYPIVARRVGEAKAETSYAWKEMLNLGITISGGSDSPVESFNPFYGIWCAVTRTDLDGNPRGGWLPEQKLTVAEAVALYSTGSAYAEGKDQVKGKIAKGYLADCILLDRDIFTVPVEQIKDTKVLTSWIGGKVAYQA